MAIEAYDVDWGEANESRDVPGLARGVYVDINLRDAKSADDSNVETSEFGVDEAGLDEDDLNDSGSELAELGYGPSSTETSCLVSDLSQQFGGDPEADAIVRALNGTAYANMDDLNASELVMAGEHVDDLSPRDLVLAPEVDSRFESKIVSPKDVDSTLLAVQLAVKQNFTVRYL